MPEAQLPPLSHWADLLCMERGSHNSLAGQGHPFDGEPCSFCQEAAEKFIRALRINEKAWPIEMPPDAQAAPPVWVNRALLMEGVRGSGPRHPGPSHPAPWWVAFLAVAGACILFSLLVLIAWAVPHA